MSFFHANQRLFCTDWDVPMTPLHSTDKGKYVIPILMGDADQQYSGLKDSMALAVHLNRTLILPPMYRSENDEARENGDVLIDPSIRLDIDQVRTYVHTIPLVNGLSVCEGKIDIGFLARPVDKSGRYNRVHEFEKATGIQISDGDKEMSIPLQPTIDQISDSNRGIVAPIDSPMWAQVYANEARCAAWILPYMSMDIASSWHQNPQGLPSMIQHELVEHSTIPRYAMTIAADFLEKHFQGSSGFMGVHWKFDSSDWIKGCDKLDKAEKQQACDILSKATHRDITGGILAYMSEKFDKKKHSVENIKNYRGWRA